MSIIAIPWKRFGRAGMVLGSLLAALTIRSATAAGAWTMLSMPGLASADIWLAGVSCSSIATCTAVGNYASGSTIVTLAERWTGGGWTIQPTPNPGGAASSSLHGVACPSATSCIAVGASEIGSYNTQAFAERWDGSLWTLQPTPVPV